MNELHTTRLAEIDDELARIDSELEQLVSQRRANPTESLSRQVQLARSRRKAMEDERAEVEGDVAAIRAVERSQARVEQRARGRQTMLTVLDATEQRQQIAATLDRAAQAFLGALDEMNALGRSCRDGACEAAAAAVPRVLDPRLAQQRRLLIESTAPHADSFGGPAMQYAMVIFLAKVLRRLEPHCNVRGIAQIAPGWQFDQDTEMPFTQAAQLATDSLARGAERMAYCLKEPA